MTMSVELQRALHRALRNHPNVHELRVTVNPHVLRRLRSEDEELLVEIERKYEGRLTFRSDPAYHHERFTIVDSQTNLELKD
jgi:ribonuclease G